MSISDLKPQRTHLFRFPFYDFLKKSRLFRVQVVHIYIYIYIRVIQYLGTARFKASGSRVAVCKALERILGRFFRWPRLPEFSQGSGSGGCRND